MVQCGNVMVLVCRFVLGRMQTNAHCLLQSHAFPGPQNNPYQTPDQFVINPEEDKWLTEEASCVAHNTASHYLPLQFTVLMMNVFYVMSLSYQHNEIISLSSPHMYTYIHTYIYTLTPCTF